MTEIVWIDLPEILAIHARQLSEHGGASGLRDPDLLESTLARPRQRNAYGDPDVFDLTAAYTAAIIANHPFVEARPPRTPRTAPPRGHQRRPR
jgi:death-on-curing protein